MNKIAVPNENYIAGLSIALQQAMVRLYKLTNKMTIPKIDRANESTIYEIAIAMKLTGYNIDEYAGDELTKSRIKLLMNRYLEISDSLKNLYYDKLLFLRVFKGYFTDYSFYYFLNENHIAVEVIKHVSTSNYSFAEFAFYINEFNVLFAKIEKKPSYVIYNDVITKGNLATAVRLDLEELIKFPTKNI